MLNRVWPRVCPILGLLLLLSVIPLLSDNSEPINQVNSAKVSSKEDTNLLECLHVCISSPRGVRGNLNADLNSQVKHYGEPLPPSVGGSPGQILNCNKVLCVKMCKAKDD